LTFAGLNSVGFTLVELLVVIAIIGALVSLLLPAVQSTREVSRRTHCQNNLRQIGLGLLQHHNNCQAFPVGCVEWRPYGGSAERQIAWSAYLLPYVEQQTLFAQLDLTQAFDAPQNAAPAATRLPVYLCPSNAMRQQGLPSERGPSDYGGIYGERITGPNSPAKGAMLIDTAVSIKHIVDGTSVTLIVAEDSAFADGQWINGRNIFDQAFAINAAPAFENDIRSEHADGANGLAADGSVHFLSNATDKAVLAALCTRASGDVTGGWQ